MTDRGLSEQMLEERIMADVVRSGRSLGLAGLTGALLLGGCVVVPNDDDRGSWSGFSDRTISYSCDDDRRMSVAYSDNGERAAVRADDDRYDLRLADEDDGRRVYRDRDDGDEVILRVSRGGADLQVDGGRDYEDCDANI
jgi:hypothetical protein